MKNIGKKRINQLKTSKDGKALISNFGYLSLLQFAGYIFPIITIPYLARVLGVENFGKIAFANAIMVWIMTVTDWGFNFTATRDLSRVRDNKEKVSDIFSDVFWARCALMIASFVFLVALIYLVPLLYDHREIILVSFLIVPGHILFPEWFFQGMERMKYITLLNLFSKLLFTVLVFVVIKNKTDYLFQPLLASAGFFVAGISSLVIIFKWGIKLKKPSLTKTVRMLASNTDVFLNNLMPHFYRTFSIIILGFFGGSAANGVLDAANKFMAIARQFMSVLSRAFFPFLSRRIEKHNLFKKLNIGISSFLSLGIFFSAPLFIKTFFTTEFYDAIIVLRILSISIFFIALTNIYGTNFMIIKGYEKELRNITVVGSLIGFIIAVPLIYYFDFIGAAITITVSRGILGLGVMVKAKNIKRSERKLKSVLE